MGFLGAKAKQYLSVLPRASGRKLVPLILLIGAIYFAYSNTRLHSWLSSMFFLTAALHMSQQVEWIRKNYLTNRGRSALGLLLIVNSSLVAASGAIISFVYSPTMSSVHKKLAYLLAFLIVCHVTQNRFRNIAKKNKG